MNSCIIIASHINYINRTKMLMCCLHSLINQTITIPIYLSISFESILDKQIFNKVIEKNNLVNNILLCIIYQEKQTSQFRHIEKIVNNIKNIYNYVFFCDDDDTYEFDRVEKIMIAIEYGDTNCPENKTYVGAYESDLQKGSHSIHFYEYWSYCVNIKFIITFINIIKIHNYDYFIDYQMCDVLFSQYLRHLDNTHVFTRINEKLYNYISNEYSITSKIKKKSEIANKCKTKSESNYELFMQGLNKDLDKQMNCSIKSNIFLLYSMSKLSFEDILKKLLGKNYEYKNDINKKIIEIIQIEYDNIKYLCEILYQYK